MIKMFNLLFLRVVDSSLLHPNVFAMQLYFWSTQFWRPLIIIVSQLVEKFCVTISGCHL